MHHRYLDKMCSLKRANDAFFQIATPPLGARTRPKRGRGRERERETFIDNQEVTQGGSHRLWALGHTVQAWAMVHLVLHFKERLELRVDHRHRHLSARGSVCVESLFNIQCRSHENGLMFGMRAGCFEHCAGPCRPCVPSHQQA